MATKPLAENRVCRKCGVEKPLTADHFMLQLGRLTRLCRSCNRIISRAYFQRNRERMLAAARDARKADPEFHRQRQKRYYRDNIEAHKASDKKYREANREKRSAAHLAWERANPERKAAYGKARREKNREGETRRMREWRRKNKDRINAKNRANYDPERSREYSRRWYAKHADRIRANAREWRAENKAKMKEWDHRRRVANGSGVYFTAADVEMIYAEQNGLCTYCEGDLSASCEADHFIPISKGGGHEPHNIVLACMPCNRSKGAKLPWVWKPDLFRAPPTII